MKTFMVRFGLIVLGLTSLAVTGALAGTYYWDCNNNTAGFGPAGGTWAVPTLGTTTNGWTTDSTGGTVVNGNSVTTTTSDDLNFGTASAGLTAGTVLVSGNTSAGTITFGAGQTAALTLGNAGTIVTLQNGLTINSGAGAITISSPLTLPATQTWANNAANALTVGSVIYGSGGVTKTGTGTNILNYAYNQFTGPITVSGGRVKLGAQYALWKSAYDTTGATGPIGLDLGTVTAPVIGGVAGNVNLATAVTGYGSVTALTLNPQADITNIYSGVIASGAANMSLVKTGPGVQILTGNNTYSGGTTNYAGTLAIGGASGAIASTSVSVYGGTLGLDNSEGWVNRIPDAAVLRLGSLTLTSSNGAGVQAETVGATTLGTSGKITVNNGTGGSDQTTLALGAVTRSAGVAIDFVGTGTGALGGGVNSPNVTSTGAWPGVTNDILPWATVGGTNWATTNANGIVAYAGTFVDPTVAASNSTQNAQLSGSGSVASSKAFNSLNALASASGQSLSLGANLNLTSGGLLKSGSDAYTISSSGGTLGAGAGGTGTELIAHVDGGTLTISAPLNNAIVGLAKGGAGTLVLSGSRNGTWANAISIAGGQLEFTGNTIQFNGAISGPGGITVNLSAGQKLIFSGQNKDYSGPTLVKGGIFSPGTAWNAQSVPSVGGTGSINSSGQGFTSNFELNGGIILFLYETQLFLGSGPGQIQLTGGTSGFTMPTNPRVNWTINNDANYEVVWGSAFFKPDVLLINDAANAGYQAGIPNKIDLNGATRTIQVDNVTYWGQLTGVIRNSTGTAGLTKLGLGELQLSAANTFNGPVTVNQGRLAVTGNLANGGLASALGASGNAASNLLLANGTTLRYTNGAAISCDRSFTINGTANGDYATLDASGAGALVLSAAGSPAYGTSGQTRTLILGGVNTGTNTLAASIADNGGAAVSVLKTGAGTWVLTGSSSSYTGPTTLNAGTLVASSATALPGYNVAGKVVLNSGTLQLTLNGSAWTESQVNTLVTNATKVGGVLALDVTGTQTQSGSYNLGAFGLTKTGAGTLVLTQPTIYTGPTSINGGVLQFNDGATMSLAPLLLSGATTAFVVNRNSNTAIQGVDIPSVIMGTGSITNIGPQTLVLNSPYNFYSGTTRTTSGTIQLNHNLALQNSALDTTGAGAFALGTGVTTPTFGGVSGASGDLSSILSGYGNVTALTLNPQSGVTVTNGGVIADGASGMTLTKSGAGTQVLQGGNTYSGATYLNAGTLELSGSGSILNSAITFTGGGLKLSNTAAETPPGRVSDSAAITANGGTLTYNNTSANSVPYAETIGPVTLTRGQLDIVEANTQTGTGSSSQTLTLSNLTQSGTAAITFSAAATGPQALGNKNMIAVSGQGSTAANKIIGPWATVGTTTNAQTNYAVYNANYVVPFSITAVANDSTWGTTWADTNNYNLSGGTGLTQTRSINSLLYSGAASTLTNGNFALQTYGLLNGGSGILTVTNNGSGVLTTPAAGNLYITPGNAGITIYTPINDNGTVTLVKNGGNTLTLSSTASTFSGGIVLNAGALNWSADSNLGNATNSITVNGNVSLNPQSQTATGSGHALIINDGAVATLNGPSGAGGDRTFPGVLSGNGTLICNGQAGILLTNTANTFTGPLTINYNGITIASLGDSSNPIINNGYGFTWTGAAKTFALRPFYLGNTAASPSINNNGSGPLTILQNLVHTGAAGAKTLTLGGSYTTTANTFVGNITDGPGSVVSLNRGGSGSIWALAGTNTYSGPTTISFAGSTITLTLQGMQALSPLTSLNSASTLSGGGGSGGTYRFLDDSATPTSRSGVNLNLNAGENADTSSAQNYMYLFVGNNSIANGGTSASTQSGSTIQLGNMNFNQSNIGNVKGAYISVSGANGYKLQLNNVTATLQSGFAGNWTNLLNASSASVIVAGNVQQAAGATSANLTLLLDGADNGSLISGQLLDSADSTPRALALTKQGAGTWTLSGANMHTGTNNLNGGTLVFSNALALGSGTIKFTGGTLKYGTGFTNDLSSRIMTSTGAVTVDCNGQSVTFASAIDSSNTNGLTKTGAGTLTLSGANAYGGVTTLIGGGTLALDYSSAGGTKLSDTAALTLSGGTLTLNGGSHVEVVGSTTINTAGSFLTRSGGSSLRMNAITRAVGSTIEFGAASIADTDTSNTNGILGGWATIGNDWAVSASGAADTAITALSSYSGALPTSGGGASSNYTLTVSQTQSGAVAANSVKIVNSGNSQALDLGAYNLTITSVNATNLGGILYAGGNDNLFTIAGTTGRIVPSGANQELIFNVRTGTVTVSAYVAAAASSSPVTKTGPGTLVLSASNTYTGVTYVNQGALRLAHAFGAGATNGAINIRTGAALELAGGISIGAKPISTLVGAGLSSGGALRNVSGNNTYGGAITVGAGGTRINSDSGTLTITNGIVTAAGNDLTVGGAGNVSISGIISGAGGVTKDGNGTLTLSANNTYSGATTINAGTLAGVTGGSCSNSAVTVASAGTLQVQVTDSTKQWACASLALNSGSQVRFTFSVTPSTNLAPLNVLGNLTFSGTPTIVVDPSRVAAGQIYPLLVVGGTAPSTLPTLSGIPGKLFWGGTGNKTLYLKTTTGMVLSLE